MDSFDINRLTDFDFEMVCKDLFEKHLNIAMEIFTPGRDTGIDLRYMAQETENTIIVQCKHWPQSTTAKLILHLKIVEFPKVHRIGPDRYIIATSARLTPSAKDKIKNALYPYIKSTGDIYGLQEISSLLRKNPAIVRRHIRLWLSSSSVLQSLLNKRLLTRSMDLTQEMRRTALIYVPNPSHRRALEILEEQHVCIIAGIPGIGKTTLAQILAYTYADQGYETYEISGDADEINAAWDDETQQFFYYDDFLGQTALDDKLNKNEDTRLLKILRRIRRMPNKRLVLTTREYILEQSRQKYERIGSEDFNPRTCVLSIADYTNLIRAEILYNHVYFSSLTAADKACFARPEIYNSIITNSKFNPRLIDASIRDSASRGLHGEEVAREILSNLISPHRLWEHIVQNQLNSLQVEILIVLFSLPPRILLESLASALGFRRSFNEHHLRRSLKVLESTMTHTSPLQDGAVVIEFHNPSIRDYMREYVFGSLSILSLVLKTANYFEQVEQLWIYFDRWRTATAILNRPEIRENVIGAVLRTFKRPPISQIDSPFATDDEIFRRGRAVLDIAQKLDSSEIMDLLHDWFQSVGLYDALPNADDLLTLTKCMLNSNSEDMLALVIPRMGEIVDYLAGDTSTWDNARYAQRALEEIYTSTSPWNLSGQIRDRIDDVDIRVEEEARDAIHRVTTTGEIPSWLARDIDEILQYAEDFDDPDDLFPGYTEAKDLFARTNSSSENSDSLPPVDQHTGTPDDETTIRHMFSMLKN